MLAIVNHHYIRTNFESPYPSIYGQTPKEFEEKLLAWSKVGTFIEQEKLKRAIEQGTPLPENSILITFDDGLAEQYHLALPILDKLGIPAVFYINTRMLTEEVVLNVHKIHILRSAISPEYFLSELVIFIKDLELDVDFQESRKNGLELYKYDTPKTAELKYILNFQLVIERKDQFVNQLFTKIFPDEEVAMHRDLYMSPKDIATLARRGFIGSHAHDHRPVALLNDKEQYQEVNLSKQLLEDLSGVPIYGFSFPYGSQRACHGLAPKLQEAGYSYGITMERALNVNMKQPFYLSRMDNNDMPLGKSYTHEEQDFFQVHPAPSWVY